MIRHIALNLLNLFKLFMAILNNLFNVCHLWSFGTCIVITAAATAIFSCTEVLKLQWRSLSQNNLVEITIRTCNFDICK